MTNTKQIILVREDLKMNIGKTAAQTAHAAMLFILHHIGHNVPFTQAQLDWMYYEKINIKNWEWGGMKKIILGVKDLEELTNVVNFAQSMGIEAHLVHDEGLDAITCAALGPCINKELDLVTDHLVPLGKVKKNSLN